MNIENEKEELKAFITSKVKSHTEANGEEVKFLQAGFNVNDELASFCIYFETEDDGPNGEWTMAPEDCFIERNEWIWSEDKPENHGEILEKLIKDTFIELREEGAFKDLPKTAKCDFGIESMCGCYGWPVWEDRGKENLLESA